jgi:hypothetical protein
MSIGHTALRPEWRKAVQPRCKVPTEGQALLSYMKETTPEPQAGRSEATLTLGPQPRDSPRKSTPVLPLTITA